jgi:hypothetical protein
LARIALVSSYPSFTGYRISFFSGFSFFLSLEKMEKRPARENSPFLMF